MDGEYMDIDMNVDDTMSFQTTTSTTSLGLPVLAESVLGSISAITGIVVLNLEKTNNYCKACAFQSIFLFLVFFISSLPFLILCLAVGGFFQTIYVTVLIIYIVVKTFFITTTVLRAKSQSFMGIPGLATWILNTAAKL
ncbi:hypothetical protein EIN_222070 [Entamoeba invadens IP1]|uniref:Uncharacterized protein n=1 Tax=Entamoeba invadens IP1 TaxID=370355 RepID=A0A0A1U232_ENTIV|nr:hypothetical protein EIN_222070 [Entamoeba invadens IP1]ELP88074.1 hypothetical protein EIN_222070 [Entamoeba invadens IP1]|eukprot:XP_004254845.1 hypothetical protein EIN_222070 [Entamoeba invadens IP1]